METDNESPQCEMPRYIGHKIVHALKLRDIQADQGGIYLVPHDNKFAPIKVAKDWYAKRIDQQKLWNSNPIDFGYLVSYEDGYRSWSPSDAFEKGYTEIKVGMAGTTSPVECPDCNGGSTAKRQCLTCNGSGEALVLVLGPVQ